MRFKIRRIIAALSILFYCILANGAKAAGTASFDASNPIDADYGDVMQGLDQSGDAWRAQSYRNAWRGEVQNLTGTEGTLDGDAGAFMQAVDGKAKAQLDALHQARVYREAGQQLLSRAGNYTFLYPQNYTPLLQSLLACEVVHYDAFNGQPDAWTSACVIGQMTVFHSRFAGTYVSATDDGLYIFPSERAPVTPAALYADAFAKGVLQSPPPGMPSISGSADQLVVRIASIPAYIQNFVVENVTIGNNTVTLTLDLSRENNATGRITPLGQAVVVFTKDLTASCGYTLVSFTPQYPAFKPLH